jgi:hypothetical protein
MCSARYKVGGAYEPLPYPHPTTIIQQTFVTLNDGEVAQISAIWPTVELRL